MWRMVDETLQRPLNPLSHPLLARPPASCSPADCQSLHGRGGSQLKTHMSAKSSAEATSFEGRSKKASYTVCFSGVICSEIGGGEGEVADGQRNVTETFVPALSSVIGPPTRLVSSTDGKSLHNE